MGVSGSTDADKLEFYVNANAVPSSYEAFALNDTIVSGAMVISTASVTGGVEIRFTTATAPDSSWNSGVYVKVSLV
jgi:hypothetical protein